MKSNKKLLTVILSAMLMTAMVFGLSGCGSKEKNVSTETTVYEDGAVIGEGDTVFEFSVINTAGEESVFEVHTNKETVGDALLENGVIAGEDGDYGLYVKTVNGETVDFEEDGKYWAFYINGEYGMTGVDATTITEWDSYAFKVE